MRKKTRTMLVVLALVLLGGWFYHFLQPSPQRVSYHELLSLIEEAKTTATHLSLVQHADGTLLLEIEDTTYVSHISPQDSRINEVLEKYPITFSHVEKTNWWNLLFSGAILVFVSMIFWNFWKVRSVPTSKKPEAQIPTTTFSDIGGLSEETKGEIKQILGVFSHPETASSLGIRPAKGLLLHGPPGTGKTLLARAIAHEVGSHFVSVSGASFAEMFVGVGAKRVRDLFEKARKQAPTLVFIDEFDALAGKRGGDRNEERESTLNELLTQLDGTSENDGVLVVAATNRLDMLDPACIRAGRFDYKMLIPLPDLEGRKEIISIHQQQKPFTESAKKELHSLAHHTTGCSGADIEGLFLQAGNHAFMHGRREIDTMDLHYALDRMILGNKNRQLVDQEVKKRVAYHEAGHALIQAVTTPGSIRKATIIPRGEALGFVAPVPKELALYTKSELFDKVNIALAGGVAEKKIFGEHSAGVSGDIEAAKHWINVMVDSGMAGESMLLHFSKKEQEEAKKTLFSHALHATEKLLDARESSLHAIATALLERETLSGEEIETLL